MTSYDPDLLAFLSPKELEELNALIDSDPCPWYPQVGPQMMAHDSQAQIVGYGGAAGGGKSSLACGLAITQHRKAIIFRENGTELQGILDELTRIIGSRDGYNGQDKIWRFRGYDGTYRQIELGSYPNPGDEIKYQGRDHDLIVYDEAANHREIAVRFLMGWLRSTVEGQRCRVLMTFNPPTTAEGRWVISFFGPWLDKKHPNPAKPGELRWFATVNGKDIEVDSNRPFVLRGEECVYDFEPKDYNPADIITPLSRTFIPSRVTDNVYLRNTGYMNTLQGLPEPLRSQMLNGDFGAGMEDSPWQVIPTAWVEAATQRWTEPNKRAPMDAVGVDVARGGKDNTVIARRHGQWYDKPIVLAGSSTPNGSTVAGATVAAMRDHAPIHIDVIGVGASPYDYLMDMKMQVIGVNVSEAATSTDRSGRLHFRNLRSQLWWKFRELLDPENNTGIALPPDDRLMADLCAPTWCVKGTVIQVESREEIVKRIGRSPDWASAYVLAQIETAKASVLLAAIGGNRSKIRGDYDPYANL
jgi:hypothetical protein